MFIGTAGFLLSFPNHQLAAEEACMAQEEAELEKQRAKLGKLQKAAENEVRQKKVEEEWK